MFKKKETAGIEVNAPAILFWVAAVALVMFDARVLDVVYQLTMNYLLTIGSLFATGAMFFIWKVAFQYPLANKTQATLSSVGMALSLLASAIFGGMDFFQAGGLLIDTGSSKFGAVDLLFWGIPALSTVHLVMMLWYWYVDPKVVADRKKTEADEDAKFATDTMRRATNLLTTRTEVLAEFVTMANTYGKQAALKQLESLGLDPEEFKNVEVQEKPNSDPSMTAPSVHDQPEVSRVPVMASANGHGRHINPTVAG